MKTHIMYIVLTGILLNSSLIDKTVHVCKKKLILEHAGKPCISVIMYGLPAYSRINFFLHTCTVEARYKCVVIMSIPD